MSIKTKDSLNCPCNGIYKCGFHSPIELKFVTDPYTREEREKFMKIYLESTPLYVSPCVTIPFPKIIDDWWRPQLPGFLDSKEKS